MSSVVATNRGKTFSDIYSIVPEIAEFLPPTDVAALLNTQRWQNRPELQGSLESVIVRALLPLGEGLARYFSSGGFLLQSDFNKLSASRQWNYFQNTIVPKLNNMVERSRIASISIHVSGSLTKDLKNFFWTFRNIQWICNNDEFVYTVRNLVVKKLPYGLTLFTARLALPYIFNPHGWGYLGVWLGLQILYIPIIVDTMAGIGVIRNRFPQIQSFEDLKMVSRNTILESWMYPPKAIKNTFSKACFAIGQKVGDFVFGNSLEISFA